MAVEQAQGQPHVQRYPVIQKLVVGGEVSVGKIQIGEHRFVGNECLVVQGKGLTNHRRLIAANARVRSEEHTSELQSRGHLVCRLLLEKKKKRKLMIMKKPM